MWVLKTCWPTTELFLKVFVVVRKPIFVRKEAVILLFANNFFTNVKFLSVNWITKGTGQP